MAAKKKKNRSLSKKKHKTPSERLKCIRSLVATYGASDSEGVLFPQRIINEVSRLAKG